MKTNKNMLRIFFGIAFGMPVILGIFMGIAFGKGRDVSSFPLVWMYLPASAVMVGALLTHKKEHGGPALPKALYLTFPAITAVMAVLAVVNVFLPQAGLTGAVSLLVYLSCLICFLEIIFLKKDRRSAWGLSLMKNWKGSLAGIVIFVLLYLALTGLSFLVTSLMGGDLTGYSLNPYMGNYLLIILPLNLLLSFTAFFGEEYGWRYYLQPALQEKLGLKKGVIVLGLLWGIWHLPINLFYYSPSSSFQSILVQLAGCVGMGIFFGWVYMRTKNIWAVTIIHFLNNNLGMALFLVTGAGVERHWGDTVLTTVLYLIVYLPFLLTKEYRKKQAAQYCEGCVVE